MPYIRYTAPDWVLRWEEDHDLRWEDHESGIALDDVMDLPPLNQRTMMTLMQANEIINAYEAQGFTLTLRQLYYQFVSKDLIPNNDKQYDRLGRIVSDARMWGMMDWSRLVDRGRNFLQRTHWGTPDRIIEATAHSFAVDRWAQSENRVEVWIEKQALEDVVAQAARPFDVGYISCKGYMSQTAMWEAAQRLIGYEQGDAEEGQPQQQTIILHLGDHDPSGIDMTRDIRDRLRGFGSEVDVRRIALTMEQIEEYRPPPNPAKVSDSRAKDYIQKYGRQSWELDALTPEVLINLIQDEIRALVDDAYDGEVSTEQAGKRLLRKAAVEWDTISEGLLSDDAGGEEG